MRSVGSALNMAHTNGMVHRDLKPQNIVSHRFESGEVVHKVIDFGLVNVATGGTPLTEAHEFLGTVAYAAPEQFTGETASKFSDQYSLGVIVYELLAGVRPIQGDGFLVLVDQHLNASPVPLGERRPDLPAGAVDAVMRALAKNPRDRWPSIAAFVQALGEDDENPTVARVDAAAESAGDLRARSGHRAGPVRQRDSFRHASRAGDSGRDSHLPHADARRSRSGASAVPERGARAAGAASESDSRARFRRGRRDALRRHRSARRLQPRGAAGARRSAAVAAARYIRAADRRRDAALHKRGGLISGLHPGIIRVVRDGDSEHVAISTAGVAQIQDVLSTLDEQTLRAQSTDDSELRYVAPELLTGKTATERSDIYTIGVVGYEMATGRTPVRRDRRCRCCWARCSRGRRRIRGPCGRICRRCGPRR